ncbi:hypothetical protein LTR91_014023 [Friedmanniomyces endolithicus]|uniref:BZIP domain-containing protein n=1 Tax=Friedmanniomyces endolithicus TaxID=329885 RepID=A0AAN6FM91_9PEZI|nr:hypothetical protein LTR35_001403 [Friedmanniomyces endolithicus]KAK0297889.1 hypothetical protein LTS00_003427 [Friedmanniomyces endolithicus]KAK0319915.1 hypothetical protein LTR82_009251 [Friedmanniomyces endolithicus]KAK0921467.1 hypothetical protein LTR57_008709 [Friedmanniomyces endolithicus]KAK0971305.1 hypothetical protein LTS01_015424 [Friedmanniomyces endolithicus]
MDPWGRNPWPGNPYGNFTFRANSLNDQIKPTTTDRQGGVMSVKVESLLAHTCTNAKTPDFTTLEPHPSVLSGLGIQRMQPGNAVGLEIGSVYSHAEELHPRGGAGRDSDASSVQQEDRVPIQPAGAPGSNQVARASGPMSSSVVIPNRPKPGRKPIAQEDAADRRRIQNRMAQRSFRDKRQQKLADTQMELEERKRAYEKTINELERKLDAERREKQELVAQIEGMVARLQNAEGRAGQPQVKMRQTQAFGSNVGYLGTAPPLSLNTNQPTYGGYGPSSEITPPGDSAFGHIEQDFTAYRAGAMHNGHRQAMGNDGSMDFGTNIAGNCGFCTDDQNCACKQEQAQQMAEQSCASVPGTCAACRADPSRAQACRDLATVADFSSHPSTSDPSGMYAPRTSCSQLVGQFRQMGERRGSISEYFDGQIQAYPNAVNGGFDVDEQQAAEVLQTLSSSRRSTMISPTNTGQRHVVGDASRGF